MAQAITDNDEPVVSDDERKKRRNIMDKRSGADLKRKWEQGDREALEARRKDLSPDRITVPQCHVCTSEHREWIEEAIMHGQPYQRIARRILDEKGEEISRGSVAEHYRKGHMDLHREAVRAELEDEARALQQNIEDSPRGAVTDRGILKVMASKGFQDIIAGVTTVEPKDLISIIKLLNDLQSNASNARAEENENALHTFVRAIENVCSQEMIVQIVTEAERLKKLDDVTFEMEGIIITRDPPDQKQLVEG